MDTTTFCYGKNNLKKCASEVPCQIKQEFSNNMDAVRYIFSRSDNGLKDGCLQNKPTIEKIPNAFITSQWNISLNTMKRTIQIFEKKPKDFNAKVEVAAAYNEGKWTAES